MYKIIIKEQEMLGTKVIYERKFTRMDNLIDYSEALWHLDDIHDNLTRLLREQEMGSKTRLTEIKNVSRETNGVLKTEYSDYNKSEFRRIYKIVRQRKR